MIRVFMFILFLAGVPVCVVLLPASWLPWSFYGFYAAYAVLARLLRQHGFSVEGGDGGGDGGGGGD